MFVAMMQRDGAALNLLVDVVPDAFPGCGSCPPRTSGRSWWSWSTRCAPSRISTTPPVVQLITEWRNTAEVHADPELSRILTEDTGDYGAATGPPAV